MAIPAGIDAFKSTISRRNGLAQQNYFSVFMPLPLFSLDAGNILENALSGQTNPTQLLNDPRDIGLLCESCSLPGRTITTADYQTNKQSIKMPYSFLNEDVTFTFLLTQDYYMRDVFDHWMDEIINFEQYKLKYKSEYTSEVIIEQLTKQGIPTYSIKLEKAYPIAVSAIELSNTAGNTLQRITVTMTYDNFFKEDAATSLINKIGLQSSQIAQQFDVGVPAAYQQALTNLQLNNPL